MVLSCVTASRQKPLNPSPFVRKESLVHSSPSIVTVTCLLLAAQWIRFSKKPLIVAGGGVIYSEATEHHDACRRTNPNSNRRNPSRQGRSALESPGNLGAVGANGGLAANRLAHDADLVIAVGTRLADFTTASWTAFENPDVKFIGLNVARMDAFKAGALGLVGDAREGLLALHDRLSAAGYRTSAGYHLV